MNKREERWLLEKELARSISERETWQDRPFTAVSLTVNYNGILHKNIRGWAKCRWPDKWDPEYGVELATKKAISRLAKLLMQNMPYFHQRKLYKHTDNVTTTETIKEITQ